MYGLWILSPDKHSCFHYDIFLVECVSRHLLDFVASGSCFVCRRTHFFLNFHASAVLTKYPSLAADTKDTSLTTTNWKEDQIQVSGSPDLQSFQEEPAEDIQNTKQDGQKMIRVCDKLIEVFLVDKPTATDWRRLLTCSREWNNLRAPFYQRCQERADEEENPEMKHKLLRLRRKLKEIDEDIQRHNELLEVVRGAPSEIGEVVAKRRKDFTEEFFVHLHNVAASYYDKPEELGAIAEIGNVCLAAVEAYDKASESIEAIRAAELKLQDILNSPSLDAACKKIDSLAEKNQLDSSLVLMITKAWAAAKETNIVKDEVKDMLFHLYLRGIGSLQRQLPKEIRIVKYLLTIEDPEEKLSALRDAFTPGEETEGMEVDMLYTYIGQANESPGWVWTPERLYTMMKAVVDAYRHSQEGTPLKEARDLLNPKIIPKLEELKKIVQDHFL
ncbi:hypothetical protein Cgig2_032391 [Carnegiea gigantea]|uniref:Uncharacterized protein n=1 Tax=Carnegiea gigantea TaxID=171969 RepID=A0A9Q1JGK1_9CARY|nr:hypothetical protein Cgig2_032391 [Carnegiea gigantea]